MGMNIPEFSRALVGNVYEVITDRGSGKIKINAYVNLTIEVTWLVASVLEGRFVIVKNKKNYENSLFVNKGGATLISKSEWEGFHKITEVA